MIPARADGPPERAERQETVARSREALQTLKPQELRALSLLAEGYSYKEIGEITGFSQTKINRCLAEGREKFRGVLSSSRDGSRCEEMRPLLSAFCDDEASSTDAATLREHLRACANCRGTLRAYRAAPGAAAALAPALPLSRSLLDRVHDAFAGLAARFGDGGDADSALQQVAASGGARGAGVAALAKVAAICVGTAGGAAACVATGIVPAPLDIGPQHTKTAVLERTIEPVVANESNDESGVDYETAPAPTAPDPEPAPPHPEPTPVAEAVSTPAAETSAGATEYAPPPPAPVAPEATSASGSTEADSGSPAGEFGP